MAWLTQAFQPSGRNLFLGCADPVQIRFGPALEQIVLKSGVQIPTLAGYCFALFLCIFQVSMQLNKTKAMKS